LNYQTIENLTFWFLKKENWNHVHETIDGIGDHKACFASIPSSSHAHKVILTENKKKRAWWIAKFKHKIKCNYCCKKGHWEKECSKRKQISWSLKQRTNVTISIDFENESALFFTSVTFNNHHLPKKLSRMYSMFMERWPITW